MHVGAGVVGISPVGSGNGEGSEGWWQKAPQSAPDFRALVFVLVGQGGSGSDWTKKCALHSSLHLTWIHVWIWVFPLHLSSVIWQIKRFYLKLKMLELDYFFLCVCGSFSTLFLEVICLKETLPSSGKVTAWKGQKLFQLYSVVWLCWIVTVCDLLI